MNGSSYNMEDKSTFTYKLSFSVYFIIQVNDKAASLNSDIKIEESR